MTNMVKRPVRSELLMPAGSLEKLKTAILYGADAVYCGTPDLSLRTKSEFSAEEVAEGVIYAHERGRRVYLTLNLYAHNKDVEKLPRFIETIRTIRPDGVIIADPGIFSYVKKHAPELELHVSTQANICSWLTVEYWKEQGASLAVLAREVPFNELKTIREKCPDIKLEAFVHGAMCMSYSGRCLLSNFMAERGANQGNCAQDCRWFYNLHIKLKDGRLEELVIDESNRDLFEFFLEEEFRPGDLIPVQETVDGTYFMNSKDLCLMPVLNQYLEIGIDSLKIEGRHKNQFYAACVTRAYRQAIDDWYADPVSWDSEKYMAELDLLRSRGYTMAFHTGRLTNHAHDYDTTASLGEAQFGGVVREITDEGVVFEVRNTLKCGDVLEFLSPVSGSSLRVRLTRLIDGKTGRERERVSAGQGYSIVIPYADFDLLTEQQVRENLPPLTVARSEMFGLSEAREEHIRVRQMSLKMEQGLADASAFLDLKKEAVKNREQGELRSPSSKPIVSKKDACCGRGCSGCLKFWNDEKYARARELLALQNDGRRLKNRIV